MKQIQSGQNRRFLFLQGPHGPFFAGLAKMLRRTGGQVWRVGFNRGDQAFWPDSDSYIPFTGTEQDWPGTLARLIADRGITDIVLYGDTRPIHATALKLAKDAGLTPHIFEEGYLRPYWVTYERDGSNGHSRLVDMSIDQMTAALHRLDHDQVAAPAHWGDMRQHMFYGAVYHFFVMFQNRRYQNFQPHRELTVRQEFHLYLRRLMLLPLHALDRMNATRRIQRGAFPYHLVLLQLAHDANFMAHSPFADMTEFLEVCIKGFAEGAPAHHHLVFKAHPLEDGRYPLRATLRRLARTHGLADRVHFVRGGKLARLLNDTRSAVTVNSTAAQQALWRNVPLKAFGKSVYAKPELVSDQPLAEFFAEPAPPDGTAYWSFRRYLLESSQIPGGFYSARGRRRLLRVVVDMMLQDQDPYDALQAGKAAPRQQFQVVG